MKKITTLFSALALTAIGWQANAQYCAAGPTNTFDTNLDTIYLAGDAGSALGFQACPGVLGVQNLTASQTVNVTAGGNYTADILFGTCGGNYGAVGEAWIDWNQNFVFDSAETIGTWTGTPPTTNTAMAFTVPAGAANGNTVLRIMQEESGALPLDPCGSFTYGSVTDFTINVSGGVTICNAPSNLTANNITTTTADLGWTENGASTMWDIEWGTTGFAPGAGNMIPTTSTNPQSLAGLSTGTSYDFYVRAICGPADTSIWSGPFTFQTNPDYCAGDHFYDNGGAAGNYSMNAADTTIICPDTPGDIVTATFNLFDTESGYDSLHVYDGIGTSGTLFGGYSGNAIPGPFFSADPSGCLTFVFSSDVSVAYTGWDATITCGATPTCAQPSMLAAAVAGITVDLSWMENGTAALWEVEYDVAGFTLGTGNATNTSTNPHNITGLTPSTSYDFYVRAICGAADSSAWVGPFTFMSGITCPAPSNLATTVTTTSADLSWLENGTAALWEVEYDIAGFTLGTGNATNTATNPHNIAGLTPSTNYDFYVRAICGAADTSLWTGPFTFATLCNATAAPWVEPFATAVLPICWMQGGANPWEYGSVSMAGFADYGANGVADNTAGGGGTFIGMDGSDNNSGEVSTLMSPLVDVTPLSAPELSYWVFSNNVDDAAQNKLIVEFYDGANWTVVDSIQTNLGANWVRSSTDLSTFTITGNTQVRFSVTADVVGNQFYNDILIDDVSIDELLITSVEDVVTNLKLNVYPNPNNGVFTLNVNTTDVNELNIKVTNTQGQTVFSKNNFDNINNVNEQINLNNNAKGIYFINVTSDKGVKTHKVIVQ